MFRARHFQFGGRVEGDDSLPGEPRHEAANRGQPLALSAVCQCATALLAVVIKMRLIIQDYLTGDRGDLANAGLLTSFAKMSKLLGLAQDGLRAVVANGKVFKVTRN